MNPLRTDPTRTGLLQRKLGVELNRLMEKLYSLAAARVQNAPTLNVAWGGGDWLKGFAKWLQGVAQTTVIAPAKALLGRWLGLGVQRGATRAVTDSKPLQPRMATPVTVTTALGTGGSRQRVAVLMERSLSELEGLTSSEVQGIVRLLADGMAAGMNPKKVAQQIRQRYSISKYRAERIARTEMIRAHANGQLIGFEAMGVGKLGVQAEWLYTHDGKACPKCKAMTGKVFDLEEAWGKIPLHPNCRCAWIPHIPAPLLPTKEKPRVTQRVG